MVCDECGTEADEDFARDEFRHMIQMMREAGWIDTPDRHADSGFRHECPDCHRDDMFADLD